MRSAGVRVTSARQALEMISTGSSLLPEDAVDSRKTITLLELRTFAKSLGLEREFSLSQMHPGFEVAFGNYHVALWRWVWKLTPPSLFGLFDEQVFRLPDTPETAAGICVDQHRYMVWRAIFVAGMRAGKGYEATHYRYFAEQAHVALQIRDDEIFEIAKQRKWNWKGPKVQDKRSSMERSLKFCLLVAWIPGGLWRMTSREEQLDALKRLWPHLPSYSVEAVAMAQKRLQLRWPFPTNTH